jgi:transcription elongation GreA/GreB family factor
MGMKQELYNKCFEFIENRLITIQNAINEIQKSLQSETKSSAGDKHETGRAMLQLEREKAGNQLAEIQKIKENLTKINIIKPSKIIRLGSVVYTSKSNYYISISAGQLQVNEGLFYAISPNTPIGKLLLGKTINGEIFFKDSRFTIVNVK